MSEKDIETVEQMLEVGRLELGTVGEPVWSQAIFSFAQVKATMAADQEHIFELQETISRLESALKEAREERDDLARPRCDATEDHVSAERLRAEIEFKRGLRSEIARLQAQVQAAISVDNIKNDELARLRRIEEAAKNYLNTYPYQDTPWESAAIDLRNALTDAETKGPA
jgi:chromosome segregation ATPase